MQTAAASVLKRGVELDREQKYTESLVCYEEGVQLLINSVRTMNGEKAAYIRGKIKDYMDRAESIKLKVEELKDQGKYHEQIQIHADSTGHGYETIFQRFLREQDVRYVLIEDPFIRAHHQCQNLVRFLELVIKEAPGVRLVKLVTKQEAADRQDSREQSDRLGQIRASLRSYQVKFVVEYSQTLHDRTITLSNGWTIKIGRGLDYFKPAEHKLGVGAFDMNLRKCHETTVDIFHSKTVRQI